VLRIAGSDVGEFGDAPMLQLNQRLAGGESIDLFIDARDVRGASSGSRYVRITADFVRPTKRSSMPTSSPPCAP